MFRKFELFLDIAFQYLANHIIAVHNIGGFILYNITDPTEPKQKGIIFGGYIGCSSGNLPSYLLIDEVK